MENNNRKNPFLLVEDLVVEYTSDGQIIHAVNDVSFRLEKGRTLGLVGETGAGKTTIAKSILRILPEPPAKVKAGKIEVDGENIMELDEESMQSIRGKKISMIFQDPMTALNPTMRIGQQIAEVYKLHEKGISKHDAETKAKKMLAQVGITEDRFREYPHQFSGGMKQRVIIAMALACSPELLLADEPTTALDVTIQAQVLEMINKLKVEYNTAMIMITHDLGVVAEVCDDVCIVYAGEIVESGSKEDLFDHPTHPYTIGLLGSIPHLDDTAERLHSIQGLPPDPSNLPEGCHFSPRCPYATDDCRNSAVGMTEVSPGHFCRCINAVKMEG